MIQIQTRRWLIRALTLVALNATSDAFAHDDHKTHAQPDTAHVGRTLDLAIPPRQPFEPLFIEAIPAPDLEPPHRPLESPRFPTAFRRPPKTRTDTARARGPPRA